jgi:nicotinamide riboside kinase
MNNSSPKLIVLTGPESSGKSVLGRTLAAHFKVSLVEEQARFYLPEGGFSYRMEDLIAIGEMQRAAIGDAMSRPGDIIISDTWIYVLMVWAKIRFGKIPEEFFAWQREYEAALFILCKPDFPWSHDPLREHPLHRDALFAIYLDLLRRDQAPHLIVGGPEAERFAMARKRVEKLMK